MHAFIYIYIYICPIHVYIHTYTYISVFTIVEVLFISLNRAQGLCLFIHSYMYSFNSVDCLLHVSPVLDAEDTMMNNTDFDPILLDLKI